MARWWSSTRKPSTSSGENDTAGTVTPEGGSTASSRGLHKLFRSRAKKEGTTAAAAAAAAAPNEPPPPPRAFPQQNEHQRILASFAWPTAARRPSSHGAKSYASGVSPSTSRTNSVDDAQSPRSPPRAAGRRSLSGRPRRSLAADAPPRECPGRPSHPGAVPTAVLPGSVSDPHRRA